MTGATGRRADSAQTPNQKAYEDVQRGGFLRLPRAVLGRGLTPPEKLVMMALMSFVRPGWSECRPTIDTLMEESELSRSTVIRALQSLEDKGLIVRRRDSKREANRYDIVLSQREEVHPSGVRLTPLSGVTLTIDIDKKNVDEILSESHRPLAPLADTTGGYPFMASGNRSTVQFKPASESKREPSLWEFVKGLAPQVSDRRREEMVQEFAGSLDMARQWFREGPGVIKAIRKAADAQLEDWTPEQLWAYWRRLTSLQWPGTARPTVNRQKKFEDVGCIGVAVKRWGAEVTKRMMDTLVCRWSEVKRDQTWIEDPYPFLGLLSGERAGPRLEQFSRKAQVVAARVTAENDDEINRRAMEQLTALQRKSG